MSEMPENIWASALSWIAERGDQEKYDTQYTLTRVMNEKLVEMQSKLDAVEKALAWYSDIGNYHNEESPFYWHGDCPVLDRGAKARKTLTQIRNKP